MASRTVARVLPPLAISGLVVAVAAIGAAPMARSGPVVDAATITASYAHGHRNVTINDYGTQGLGTFELRADDGDPDPGTTRLALCVEADVSHVTVPGAYRIVPNRLTSPELDYLLWAFGVEGAPRHGTLAGDPDTATALGALAWFHAGATRRGGGPVWADWARGFAPVSPLEPHPWNRLPAFGLAHPVGLRSGGRDLDAAERRVYELHRESIERRGPWTLDPLTVDGSHVVTRLHGPGGPIAGLPGVRLRISTVDGEPMSDVIATTANDGTVHVALDDVVTAATVEASVSSPGIHQEWDGDGPVQRMATGTSVVLTSTVDLAPPPPPPPPPAPPPGYLHIVKSTSDPRFAVEGARFEVRDADDALVAEVRSDGSGLAVVPPIDPLLHPVPYVLREVAAPPGLQPIGAELVLEDPLSSDPQAPTTVTVTNDPRTVELHIRKVLSDDDVGPGDLSGFRFGVTRLDDDRGEGEVVTDTAGRTLALPVTVGRFQVCETDRPEWAAPLVDPGCQEVVIGLADLDAPAELTYTNLVPVPLISTEVRDPIDGDRALPATGGMLVDRVELDSLIPGTPYELVGEVMALTGDGPVPTGLRAGTGFLAGSTSEVVEVTFEVPAAPGFTTGVVYQQLLVGSRVAATHHDPDDPLQTFTIDEPDRSTTTLATADPPPATPDPTTVPTSTTNTTSTSTTTTVPTSTTTTSPVPRPTSGVPLPRTGSGSPPLLGAVAALVVALGLGAVAITADVPVRSRRRSTGTRPWPGTGADDA